MPPLKRVHVVGRKNSGKTTLIVELVELLTARGLVVGTIKHTHHHHELDIPGKDSYKHRQAGAAPVAILSPGMTAVFQPAEPSEEPPNYEWLSPMFAACDLVLVEGDLRASAPRVEVWREACGSAPYAATDSAIAAIISNDAIDVGLPIWKRHPLDDTAMRIVALAERPLAGD